MLPADFRFDRSEKIHCIAVKKATAFLGEKWMETSDLVPVVSFGDVIIGDGNKSVQVRIGTLKAYIWSMVGGKLHDSPDNTAAETVVNNDGSFSESHHINGQRVNLTNGLPCQLEYTAEGEIRYGWFTPPFPNGREHSGIKDDEIARIARENKTSRLGQICGWLDCY